MHKNFTKWPLRRRIIVLAAAYAIALSGIIANFGLGRAAAAEAGAPGIVTCHTEITGDPSPMGGEDNDRICSNSCCIGCLMPMAALPPPSANAAGAPQSARQILPARAVVGLPLGPQTKSHQSRAPPVDV